MFKPRKSGHPKGRPKGSVGGQTRALVMQDKILGQKGNAELLEEKLQEEFQADPVRFFRNVVMPLLPKESKVDVGGGIVRWQSLIEAGPSQDAQPADWAERVKMFRESGGEFRESGESGE